MTEHIVIVGTGQAGVAVAFRLRALGYSGRITLAGDEPHFPYHRPPLSKKYMTRLAAAERLHLKQESLYASERIELHLNRCVADIQRAQKRIVFEDGEMLGYDFLVLATGTVPRRLSAEQGGDASNVYTLRTLSDATRLREEFTEGRRLLVVGGGYIGLETAAVAQGLGMEVTVIERESRILGRVASAATATYFKALHEAEGVAVLEGVGLDRLEHSGGKAVLARLTTGMEIRVDVVVVGVGVLPEIRLAQAAGLQVDNGVVVDGSGRTLDPSIYAVGDCASFPYRNGHIRLESVQNAVDMADVVARSLLREPAEYIPVPWFWSDQYSTKLQIAGLNLGYTRVAVRKNAGAGVSIWYYEEDEFLAVDAINDAKAFMTARRWLGAGYSPAFEDITDTSMDLSAFGPSVAN